MIEIEAVDQNEVVILYLNRAFCKVGVYTEPVRAEKESPGRNF
jgi:hypothetical protein